MQSPTDPADRTGTIGVEAFDAAYGAGFQASDDSPHAVECELVEDGGAFVAHRPTDAGRPRRVAFVDGTLRTEARLTRTGPDGDVSMGLAGSWAAGAVLVDGDEPARFDQVTTGRAAIFTGGQPVRLPDHRDGWRWEPYAVDGADVEAARQQLQRLMRDAEADIAEALSNDGWLTVLDGPLHGIRHRRGLPVIGYVKTHHRRMLAREHWVRVPELTAGERSGLFAMKDALYGCYLRVGDPGPWAGPWAGIARLEMPSGIGRAAAVEVAERAAGWLPGFASALHRDARAPVNLTPIAGLERHLHRLQGDARLALRAVRAVVLERRIGLVASVSSRRTPAPRSESRSSTTAAPPAAGTDARTDAPPGAALESAPGRARRFWRHGGDSPAGPWRARSASDRVVSLSPSCRGPVVRSDSTPG